MQSSPDPQALLLVVDVQQGFEAPRWVLSVVRAFR